MKTKDFRNLGIALSLSIIRILNGLSAQKAKVLEQLGFFHKILEFFGGLYLSLEDFANLYFYLPTERRVELRSYLDSLAKDFVSWKTVLAAHRYSAKNIREMILSEMSFCVKSFQQAYDGFCLSDELIIRQKFLNLMKEKARLFEEKLQVIRCSHDFNEEDLQELFLMIKNFSQANQFTSILGLDDKNVNKGARKMLALADDFKKINRTHRRAIPGSSLRREIVSIAENHELPQGELLQYYYEEKYWSNFKRMLFRKIEKLVLGIEDWLEVLLLYGSDRKLKNLIMNKMRQLGLTFYQLNNTLVRAKDPEIKLVILEEMFLLSRNHFDRLKIVSVKSEDFPQVFLKAFSALLDLVSNQHEAEMVCDILASSRNKHNFNFILKVASLDLNFDSLDKLFNKSPKEGKIVLLPQMKLLARSSNDLLKLFNYYSIIDDLKERQRKQNSCLKEALSLLGKTDNINELLSVYRTALISANFSISNKIVELIQVQNFEFKTLLKAYEELEKNKITNNGLAAFLQSEMIVRAQTDTEKGIAFKKASLQIKSFALSKMLKAA